MLLEQLAASTAEEPLPHQPLSSAEQIAAARLGYQQIAQLAGEPEPVLHLSQRQIPGPYGPIWKCPQPFKMLTWSNPND